MVNFTLNLYNNKEIDEKIIKNNIFARNPIIFYINEQTGESIYKILNLSRVYSKNVLVLHRFDLARTLAYLMSFKQLKHKQILFMAPVGLKKDATLYSHNLLQLIKQNNVA